MGEVLTADSFAAKLSDRFLHCRELGHEWRPFTASWDPDSRSYDRTLRCRSCKSERKQVLDSHGGVVRNGYDYADGYLATNVERGFTRDTFRLEAVVRSIEGVRGGSRRSVA